MNSIENRANRTRGVVRLVLAILTCSIILSGCGQGQDNPSGLVGRELYKTCVPCHGAAAEGNKRLRAPGLAGRPAWYIERAIQAFRSGMRGTHFDDADDMLMRPFARSIATDEDVKRIASYVASLPLVQHAPNVEGDEDSGRTLYRSCSGCHGESAEGKEGLGAPPLSGLPDWYLVSQLKKFRSGVRGSKPGDHLGAIMQRSIDVLTDEEDMRDLAAYIRTLQ